MLRNTLEKPMSFREVQAFLGCGKTWLYEQLQSGRITGYKLGRKWIIYPSDLQWYEFRQAVLEFLDVEHSVEVLKLALGHIVDVAEMVEAHNRKCREKGYVKEKDRTKAAM